MPLATRSRAHVRVHDSYEMLYCRAPRDGCKGGRADRTWFVRRVSCQVTGCTLVLVQQRSCKETDCNSFDGVVVLSLGEARSLNCGCVKIQEARPLKVRSHATKSRNLVETESNLEDPAGKTKGPHPSRFSLCRNRFQAVFPDRRSKCVLFDGRVRGHRCEQTKAEGVLAYDLRYQTIELCACVEPRNKQTRSMSTTEESRSLVASSHSLADDMSGRIARQAHSCCHTSFRTRRLCSSGCA